jgi:abequosyltransferase
MNDDIKHPFLSILIPTYNRSSFLKKCLLRIQGSFKEILNKGIGIEIVVLNNGSNDDTDKVLQQFEDIMSLKILNEKDNIDFLGFLKCISNASGEYCWLLGDDDFLVNGVNDLLLFLKEKDPDILLLNHYFYTFEDNRINYIMKDKQKFLFKKSKECYTSYKDYILNVRHNNAFFTHIAPVIFRREQWNLNCSPESVERHLQSHSIHIYVFLSILKNSKRICFFQKPQVVLRAGAPSEFLMMEEGRYQRFSMDVQYFTDMFRDVFSEEDLVRHFKNVMLKKSVLVLLLGTKLRCRFSHHFYLKLLRLLYTNYKSHPFFWYGIIPVVLIPRIIFLVAYRLIFRKSAVKEEAEHTS